MDPDERGRCGLFTRVRKKNILRSPYAASCIILSRRGRTVALRRVCPAGCYAFETDATRPPLPHGPRSRSGPLGFTDRSSVVAVRGPQRWENVWERGEGGRYLLRIMTRRHHAWRIRRTLPSRAYSEGIHRVWITTPSTASTTQLSKSTCRRSRP